MIKPLKIYGVYEIAKKALRRLLLEEAHHKCLLCDRSLPSNAPIHHKDGCGLNWARDNLIILCFQCHNKLTLPRQNTKGRAYKK